MVKIMNKRGRRREKERGEEIKREHDRLRVVNKWPKQRTQKWIYWNEWPQLHCLLILSTKVWYFNFETPTQQTYLFVKRSKKNLQNDYGDLHRSNWRHSLQLSAKTMILKMYYQKKLDLVKSTWCSISSVKVSVCAPVWGLYSFIRHTTYS